MPDRDHGEDRRKHVRLSTRKSTVDRFSGERAGKLPERALVADLSEGGLKLEFSWSGSGRFPLELGDGLGFLLRIEGGEPVFELWSEIRHVAPDPACDRVYVGVEFCELEGPIQESIKKAITNLAFTKLRSLTGAVIPPSRPRRELSRKIEFEDAPPPAAAASQPAAEPKVRRRKLYIGEILVKQGALGASQLEKFLSDQSGAKRPLGERLAEHGLIDDVSIAKALAEQARLPYMDLVAETPDLKLARSVPRALFIRHHCVPVRQEGGALLVAMSTRPTLPVMEELKLTVGQRVRVSIAPEHMVAEWLKRIYNYEAPSKIAQMSFPVHLPVEYRFFDREGGALADRPAAGLTRELRPHGMVIAGPLPEGLTPHKVIAEGLSMEVQVACAKISNEMTVGCRPLSVVSGGHAGEYHIACYIDAFPEGGERVWMRICMTAG